MSQNKNNENELNTMNITDDAFLLSDEMIQAYMDVSTLETPDLWSRVSSGFDQEMQKMNEEQVQNAYVQTNVPNNVQQFVPQQNANQGNISKQINENDTHYSNTNNVIDIRKRIVRRKTIGAIAAIVIICIIAVPVMKMVGNGTKHKSDDGYTTATSNKFAAEDAEAASAAEDTYDIAGDSVSGESTINNESNQPGALPIDNVDDTTNSSADEEAKSMVTVDATGYFVYDGDTLMFDVESITGNQVIYCRQNLIVLKDSEAVAAKYFEKVDDQVKYGPFEVRINVIEGITEDERP